LEMLSPSAFASIRIVNMMGQTVFLMKEKEFENNIIGLSAKEMSLAEGFYIIEVYSFGSEFTVPLLITE